MADIGWLAAGLRYHIAMEQEAMTNIVERLHSKSPYLHGSSAERTMEEAADEIERLQIHSSVLMHEVERLRAALTVIRDAFWSEGEPDDEQRDDLKYIARRALEHKP